MKEEIWKDAKGYEGLYLISNYGNVRSLERLDSLGRRVKDRILKSVIKKRDKYYCVVLSDGKNRTQFHNHILVAINFMNHNPDGTHKLVVNHKDFDKLNNYVDNLEIVTQRENANRKHLKHSSKYTGVSWRRRDSKWISRITFKRKLMCLGTFDSEYEAHLAYEKALSIIIKKESISKIELLTAKDLRMLTENLN